MKLKLESVALVEENGQFYLDAKYLKEEYGVKSEIHYPRIEIPFVRMDIDDDTNPYQKGVPIHNYDDQGHWSIISSEMSLDLGKGKMPLKKVKLPTSNGHEVFFIEQCLERVMTVKEIEKQLGYKVKIVDGE